MLKLFHLSEAAGEDERLPTIKLFREKIIRYLRNQRHLVGMPWNITRYENGIQKEVILEYYRARRWIRGNQPILDRVLRKWLLRNRTNGFHKLISMSIWRVNPGPKIVKVESNLALPVLRYKTKKKSIFITHILKTLRQITRDNYKITQNMFSASQ